MRSIIFDGHDIQIADGVSLSAPGPGEIVVRIHASGLCQSDLSVMNGKIPFPLPVVLGHEGAGVVEEVGIGVTSPEVGDHVVLSTLASCGRCAHCVSGRPTMCRKTFGASAAPFQWNGQDVHSFAALSTFSERILVRAGQATVIPRDIPMASAALIGCAVLTGAGAVFNRARVQPGERVVVIGAGGIGLNCIQAARIAGATTIIAVDTNEEKRRQATRFGATAFLNPMDGDVIAAVRDLSAGGVDHVFECVGNAAVIRQASEMLDWGGQLVLLGVPAAGTEMSIPVDRLYLDKSIMGCRYGSARPAADIPRYIDLYRSGHLLLDELVTRTYPLADFRQLFDHARAGTLDRGVLEFAS